MGDEVDRVAADELEKTLADLRAANASLKTQVATLTQQTTAQAQQAGNRWNWLILFLVIVFGAALCGRAL